MAAALESGIPKTPGGSGKQEAAMGRFVGWTLGVVFALAISVAPAAADTRWSVGVHIGSGPVYGPVYYPPVYRAPVYRERVYYPLYEPVYYPPVYRERVIVVNGRHDNGRHNGWYKNGKTGHGRDGRNVRYDRDRRW